MYTSESKISELKTHLLAGEICVFPTDTVVGIGCLAYLPKSGSVCSSLDDCLPNFVAVRKIFQIKNRSSEKKLPWLIAEASWLHRFGNSDLSSAEKLAKKCWPGSTTLIVKAAKKLNTEFTVSVSECDVSGICKSYSTLAMRMPACVFLLQIMKDINLPIVCTSANVSCEPAVASVDEVSSAILDEVDFVFDISSEDLVCSEDNLTKQASGVASQIFDCTCSKPKQLR